MAADIHTVTAGVLDIAYERHGTPGGPPMVLLHGFPYDVRSYDGVVRELADDVDVVVPYLRGYGPTRFRNAGTPRSGQQAALAHDLLALIDALELDRPMVAGYDWGGRAACLVAALWPERVGGLVTVGGYNVQDIATNAVTPSPPEVERRLWYQFYLHSPRGRAGLAAHRAAIARQLWTEWSPTWAFTDDEFAATAPSFDNPDFVDVVVHSYRHRYALVDGDPEYEDTERRIAEQPTIDVPTVVVDSAADGLGAPDDLDEHRRRFTNLVDRRILDAGHDPPQEVPGEFADALRAVSASGGARR